MKKLNEWFSEYNESHQNETNQLLHWICIPLIFFSIIGLLWSIPFFSISNISYPYSEFINVATIGLILALIFYIRLSFKIFIGMMVVGAISIGFAYWIDNFTPFRLWVVSLIVFIIGWIGQFYGHKIEGKKPSFFKDLQFLLIGPAWVLAKFYKKLRIKI